MKSNEKINIPARHRARESAVQALYQWEMADENLTEIELQFLLHNSSKKIDQAYFRELLHEIPSRLTEIEESMRPYLTRPLEELDPVELSVLRLSIYELLYHPEIPYRVVINEALELTKRFGSSDGYKFINGVLDKFAKQLQKD